VQRRFGQPCDLLLVERHHGRRGQPDGRTYERAAVPERHAPDPHEAEGDDEYPRADGPADAPGDRDASADAAQDDATPGAEAASRPPRRLLLTGWRDRRHGQGHPHGMQGAGQKPLARSLSVP
jgi:hypothetical protein